MKRIFQVLAVLSMLFYILHTAKNQQPMEVVAPITPPTAIPVEIVKPTSKPDKKPIIETFPIAVDAEDTYISEEIQAECISVGEERGYCPELLMAIIESESSGQQYAENGSCKGLMQVNISNYEVTDYLEDNGYDDVFDIHANIEAGCFVLDMKREIYGDDLFAVLMAYNGSSKVWDRVEVQDYTYYASHIVERTYDLERLHGK